MTLAKKTKLYFDFLQKIVVLKQIWRIRVIQSLKVWWLSLRPCPKVKSAGSQRMGGKRMVQTALRPPRSLDIRVYSVYSDFCLIGVFCLRIRQGEKSKCHSPVKIGEKHRLHKALHSGEASVHLSWF